MKNSGLEGLSKYYFNQALRAAEEAAMHDGFYVSNLGPQSEYPRVRGYWHDPLTWKNRYAQTFGSHMPDISGKKVLDTGCSLGWATVSMKYDNPSAEIWAIDIYPKRIEHANLLADIAAKDKKLRPRFRRDGLHFVIADMYNSGFSEKSFDFVICLNSISVLHKQMDEDYMRRARIVASLTKDNGLFISGDNQVAGFFRRYNSEYCLEKVVGLGEILDWSDPALKDRLNSLQYNGMTALCNSLIHSRSVA
jgi:hypothetical protein